MWDGWSEDGGCLLKQPGDAHKQDQKTFYDEDALSYETQMLRLPFWNAQTAIYLRTIRSFASECRVMLEAGLWNGQNFAPVE